MATIRDVAKLAQVSTATVSRHINKSGYVSELAGHKIDLAIRQLDYQPNEIARSLSAKSSKMIGLIIPDITNPYFPQLVRGVQDGALDQGYMLIVGNSEADTTLLSDYRAFFKHHNVNGIIKVDDEQNFLTDDMHVVAVDRISIYDKYGVLMDDVQSGLYIAEAIKKTDARNVLIMRSPRSHYRQDRFWVLERELAKANIAYQSFQSETYQVKHREKISRDILDHYSHFDTFVALNDLFALAFMKEAQSRGIRIPQDIQVIGYDGLDFSNYSSPALTTVRQPTYQIGYEAADLLIKLMSHEQIRPPFIKRIKPIFVERDSLRR